MPLKEGQGKGASSNTIAGEGEGGGGLSVFFGLGVTNKAAKPECILPIGDDGSMYEDCLSGKLILMIINET